MVEPPDEELPDDPPEAFEPPEELPVCVKVPVLVDPVKPVCSKWPELPCGSKKKR